MRRKQGVVSGEAYMKRDARQTRSEKKAAKKAGLQEADDAALSVVMQEGSENDWGESCKNADDLVRQYTWLGTNGIETAAMTLAHTIDAKPVPTFIRPDAVPDYQFYRASYTNVLIERCRQADIPCVSIPTLTDDDLEGWLINLRVFYLPGLMHDDPAESQLIQNRGGGSRRRGSWGFEASRALASPRRGARRAKSSARGWPTCTSWRRGPSRTATSSPPTCSSR